MRNIIFIAPPASGKGTFSEFLKEEYGYKHISTGDLIRNSNDETLISYVNKGNLASDEIIISLLVNELDKDLDKPFVLDGFPRTYNQATELDKILKERKKENIAVINLETTFDEAQRRMLGRLICSCGRTYNLNNKELMPKVSGICDSCGSILIKRVDDSTEVLKKRFDDFNKKSVDIINYYQDNLYRIDTSMTTKEIIKEILEIAND